MKSFASLCALYAIVLVSMACTDDRGAASSFKATVQDNMIYLGGSSDAFTEFCSIADVQSFLEVKENLEDQWQAIYPGPSRSYHAYSLDGEIFVGTNCDQAGCGCDAKQKFPLNGLSILIPFNHKYPKLLEENGIDADTLAKAQSIADPSSFDVIPEASSLFGIYKMTSFRYYQIRVKYKDSSKKDSARVEEFVKAFIVDP